MAHRKRKKKKAITLDVRGVRTFAGEISSEVAKGRGLNLEVRRKAEESRRRRKKKKEREKEIVEKVPTERQPIIKPKETIQLTPEVERQEVIKLGGLTPKEFERAEGIHQLKQIGKAALIGAGIGTGLFFAGGAIIAKIAGAKVATTITSKAIQSGFAQQAAVTAKSYTATVARTAAQSTGQLGNKVINIKTISLTKNILGKVFSIKAMAFGGAWASSVFLGRWGQAEAPESIMIPIRDLIKLAETPEDWTIIEEHLQIAEELSNTSTWEDIILWSPFSAVKGIMDKVRGVAEGVIILKETAEQVQEIQIKEQETGETEFARERRETDEEAIERKKAEEERQDIRFEGIEEERIARQEEEDRRAVIMQEVWRLRREGRFSEADELELTIIS